MPNSSAPGSTGTTGPNSLSRESVEGRGSGAFAGPQEFNLQEFREDLSRLAGVVAHVAERRLARTRARTEMMMRDNPWMTVSLAAAAGYLLGLAILPRSRPRTPQSRFMQSLGGRWRDIDLAELSRMAQLPAAHHSNSSIASRLEQVIDSLSRIEPGSMASSAFDKARDWAGSLMSRVRG